MAISLRPPASRSRRLPASRTSAACARSTSASGVPRSMATRSPSMKRASGSREVRSATCCSAWGRGTPARARPRAAASSAASAPPESRVPRAIAAAGLSPAVTASARSSATTGNSASSSSSRLATCWVSHQSRPSTPPTSPATPSSPAESTFSPPAISDPTVARTAAPSSPRPPQMTCSMRKSSTVASPPSASSRRRTAARPPSTRSTSRAPSPTTGPKMRRTAVSRPVSVAVPRSRDGGGVSCTYGASRSTSRTERNGGAKVSTSTMPTAATSPSSMPRTPALTTTPRRSAARSLRSSLAGARCDAHSLEHPDVLGQPPDPQHEPVGQHAHRAAAEQQRRPGRGVVGGQRRRLGGEQEEHDPGRGHRQPGRRDDPALAGLQLGAGPGVLAEEGGERAQHPAEVAAADLPGDPQGLDDAVADRVGEVVLEPVQTRAEPAGGAVLGGEPGERRPQHLRPAGGEGGEGFGQRQPGADGGGEVVDHLGPDLAQVGPALAGQPPHLPVRQREPEDAEDQADRDRAGGEQDDDERDQPEPDLQRQQLGGVDAGQPGRGEQQLPAAGTALAGAPLRRPGSAAPHEQQADAERQAEEGTGHASRAGRSMPSAAKRSGCGG